MCKSEKDSGSADGQIALLTVDLEELHIEDEFSVRGDHAAGAPFAVAKVR